MVSKIMPIDVTCPFMALPWPIQTIFHSEKSTPDVSRTSSGVLLCFPAPFVPPYALDVAVIRVVTRCNDIISEDSPPGALGRWPKTCWAFGAVPHTCQDAVATLALCGR